MLRHFALIARRNALQHIRFTLINLLGLSAGIAVSLVLFLYVQQELGYDRFHEKADRIYRVGLHGKLGNSEFYQTYTNPQLAPVLHSTFPQVEAACRLGSFSTFVKRQTGENTLLSREEDRLYVADPAFFDMFTFPMRAGSGRAALAEPNQLLLCVSTVERYFGTAWTPDSVLGKTLLLTLGDGDDRSMVVAGIMEDWPQASHFHPDFLLSTENLPYLDDQNWQNNYLSTYILLDKQASPEALEAQLPEVYRQNLGPDLYDQWMAEGNRWESFLQPLTDIHLTSHLSGEFEPNGNRSYIYIFSTAGLLVLLLACINFINLTTARSSVRAKEVGIKQALGSRRSQLMLQHLSETFLLTLLAVGLGLLLLEVMRPWLYSLTGSNLRLPYTQWWVVPALLLFTGFIALLAGLYPSFYLTSVRPVQILRGKSPSTQGNAPLRNGLTVLQFFISTVMLAGTFVIHQQIDFLQHQSPGFAKENVLVVKNAWALGERIALFRQQLSERTGVGQASASMSVPSERFGNVQFFPEEVNDNLALDFSFVDEHFADTYDLQIRQGRFFSSTLGSDTFAVVVNETAVRDFGWENPLGKQIRLFGEGGTPYTVVGVVKDFHYASLHSAIEPVLLLPDFSPQSFGDNFISVRVEREALQDAIAHMEDSWNTLTDEAPFAFFFLDQQYEQLYRNELLTGHLLRLFSALILLVAVLGLVGLVTYHSAQRRQEIGIRKVLGASITSIWLLLSRAHLRLILMAMLMAIPVTNYAVTEWLNNFAYRIEVRWWIYALPLLIILLIALLSVSGLTLKAATRNPTDVLRNE